jgi:hypothetical protein
MSAAAWKVAAGEPYELVLSLGLFVALAVLALLAAIHWIRRRIS